MRGSLGLNSKMKSLRVLSNGRWRFGLLALFLLFRTFISAPAQTSTFYVSDQGDNRIDKVYGGVATVFSQTGWNNPAGLVFDVRTNLYVANFGSNTIVKLDTTGQQTIFAGGLNGPQGLAMDSVGYIYVANSLSNTIMRFDTAGNGSLFASTGLHNPTGLAFDAQDNLYVANTDAGAVEKFSPSGADLGAFASGISQPRGLTVDQNGQVYVTAFGDSTIKLFNANGTGGTFQVFTNLSHPIGIYGNSSYLVVANYGNGTIYANQGISETQVSGLNDPAYIANPPSGGPPVIFASNLGPPDPDAVQTAFIEELSFSDSSLYTLDFATGYGTGRPYGIAADRHGNIFVANFYFNTITEFGSQGDESYLFDTNDLNVPTGLAVDGAGDIYVANFGNNTVLKYIPFPDHQYLRTILVNSGLSNPEGVALDGNGNVYVANYTSGTVQEYSPNGANEGVFVAGLSNPVGLAFAPNGTLYITDFGDSSVQRIAPDGNDAGTLTGPNIASPEGIAVDALGNFFVANYYRNSIEEFSPSGIDLGVYATSANIHEPTFLAVRPPPITSPVGLRIQSGRTNVVLAWPGGGFNLQSASALAGPYTTLPQAYSPYPTRIGSTPTFFRLLGN